MQEGYDLFEKGKQIEGCDKWLEAWETIKRNTPENVTTLEKIDSILSGMLQSVHNWCQNLEMELHNAGIDDKKYFHKLIEFCQDFCKIFCNEDSEVIILNMKRAEADAYFELGEMRKGDEKFEGILKEHPEYIWGYIGWGDQYCMGREDRHNNYKKAEMLYIKALEKMVELGSTEDLDTVYERLHDLYTKTGKTDKICPIISKR